MYDIAAYYEASTVQEAIALRAAHPNAKIIAGGTDVLVQVRSGKLAGCELLSIHDIAELKGVTMETDGTIRIGSLTTFSAITADPVIQANIPVLGQAVDHVGGPQIRSAGTIGPHPPLPRKNGSKKSFPSQAENWKMSCLVCLD